MTKKLSLGGSGPKAPVMYFDPLTGTYGSKVRYKQHLTLGTGKCNWLPRGLNMRQVRNKDTAGYKRKRAASGVPGWVWVKRS